MVNTKTMIKNRTSRNGHWKFIKNTMSWTQLNKSYRLLMGTTQPVSSRTRSNTDSVSQRTRSRTNALLQINELNLTMATYDNSPMEPTRFEQAWNHPDLDERKNWREAMEKEIKDINKRNVWTVQEKREHTRTIGVRWVFKKIK